MHNRKEFNGLSEDLYTKRFIEFLRDFVMRIGDHHFNTLHEPTCVILSVLFYQVVEIVDNRNFKLFFVFRVMAKSLLAIIAKQV